MDNNLKNKITVLIPALNEETTIGDIITRSKKYSDDIIVVDGHSNDGTESVSRSLGVKIIFDHKKGKGEAIRSAIPGIRNEITVLIDADGSHNPDDIPKLVQPIVENRADHVSGSRLIGGSSELHGGFDECFRLMGSSLITALINHRFKLRLSESQNGFRAIKTSVLKALDLKENITTIEQEMIIKTLKKGYRMAEVSSHEYERIAGYSKIKLRKVAFRYVYSMLKYLYF
ncbi:MAG: glycosyltransferase family 2 protein [Desulfobacteraceae bacterium]|nr:MAG: glycosyltransferase family 2 protein [Desulfobacteraceae bacterium]